MVVVVRSLRSGRTKDAIVFTYPAEGVRAARRIVAVMAGNRSDSNRYSILAVRSSFQMANAERGTLGSAFKIHRDERLADEIIHQTREIRYNLLLWENEWEKMETSLEIRKHE